MTARLQSPRSRALAAGVLVAVLTIVVTWPLFANPISRVLDSESVYGGASVLVQRDINLTMWILAWDSHALVTDPLHLFDANAFYPARWSLALSEHMLGNAPFFAPVFLATGDAVLAYQWTMLASFIVAALTMAAYVRRWTADPVAALAAGCLFAFTPFRMWQLGSLHVIAIQWLPLVLLGIDLCIDGRRRVGASMLGAGLVLSSFCSYYVGYAAFTLAGAYGLVRFVASRRDGLNALPAVVAGLLGAGVIVGVLSIPYLQLKRQGVIHEDAALGFFAAMWLGPRGMTSFFLTPRRDGPPMFLGFTAMALALVALAFDRRGPRLALLAVGLTGWVLTLGPTLGLRSGPFPLPYHFLMEWVPGFSAMRVTQRFGALGSVSVTALAGLGLAATRRALLARRPWERNAVAIGAVVAAIVEIYQPGIRTLAMPVGQSMPRAHRWLAEHGDGGAFIELPTGINDLFGQSTMMYYSTTHWLPMVNGYTPYPPQTFRDFMDAATRLPDPAALERILSIAPLRWVLLRAQGIPRGRFTQWYSTFVNAGLRQVAAFPDALIFEVPPTPR